MSEEGNVLTFSELRKTQKEEDREEELQDLGDKFLLRVSNYFDKKKKNEGEKSREYRNARRVLDKIISLREEKIVKESRLSVKTDEGGKDLNLLPEEQELFRRLKSGFQEHRSRVDEKVDSNSLPSSHEPSEEVKKTTRDPEPEEDSEKTDKEDENEEKDSSEENDGNAESDVDDSNTPEEGYTIVETTSDVPEFMGTDLEAYGPFDAGETVEIPDDNAEILVNRGNAEMIEE